MTGVDNPVLPGEQWDAVDAFEPKAHNWWVALEHLGRYLFAAKLLRSEGATRVLDAACGTGFGAAELAREGLHVTALDGDQEILDYAAARYPSDRIAYKLVDLDHELGPAVTQDGPFSGAVSFETLEHLVAPEQTLRRLAALLAPGSPFICSFPIRNAESTNAQGLPSNAAHKQRWSLDGGVRLLESAGFEIEYRLGQSWVARLMRREIQLKRKHQIAAAPSSFAATKDPDELRSWAHLLAIPSPEDVEESYSQVLVARRSG